MTAQPTPAGFIPPIITPFHDGRLDLRSLHRLLDELAPFVQGVLVGGSIGEVASLTLDERRRLMDEVASHLNHSGLTVAASIADNSIENSRRLAAAATEAGAALLVASCPNYFTNDRRMLADYFHTLSESIELPLCLYDNPLASNTSLSVADIAAIAEAAPRLKYVKVTDTALDKVEFLHRETNLRIFSGDDVVLWHQLTRGAVGAMVALPLVYPRTSGRFWAAFQQGDLQSAMTEYRRISHFVHIALGAADYVSVIKTVLHARGTLASSDVRLPLVQLSDHRRAEVLEAFRTSPLAELSDIPHDSVDLATAGRA